MIYTSWSDLNQYDKIKFCIPSDLLVEVKRNIDVAFGIGATTRSGIFFQLIWALPVRNEASKRGLAGSSAERFYIVHISSLLSSIANSFIEKTVALAIL